MGNNQDKQNTQNLVFIKYSDGDGKFMFEQKTRQEFYYKNLTVHLSLQEKNTLTKYLLNRSKFRSDHIPHLSKFKFHNSNICETKIVLTLLFEHPSKSLKEECQSRIQSKCLFQEHELRVIILTCLKGLLHTTKTKQVSIKCSEQNIFINKDGKIFLSDFYQFEENMLHHLIGNNFKSLIKTTQRIKELGMMMQRFIITLRNQIFSNQFLNLVKLLLHDGFQKLQDAIEAVQHLQRNLQLNSKASKKQQKIQDKRFYKIKRFQKANQFQCCKENYIIDRQCYKIQKPVELYNTKDKDQIVPYFKKSLESTQIRQNWKDTQQLNNLNFKEYLNQFDGFNKTFFEQKKYLSKTTPIDLNQYKFQDYCSKTVSLSEAKIIDEFSSINQSNPTTTSSSENCRALEMIMNWDKNEENKYENIILNEKNKAIVQYFRNKQIDVIMEVTQSQVEASDRFSRVSHCSKSISNRLFLNQQSFINYSVNKNNIEDC